MCLLPDWGSLSGDSSAKHQKLLSYVLHVDSAIRATGLDESNCTFAQLPGESLYRR